MTTERKNDCLYGKPQDEATNMTCTQLRKEYLRAGTHEYTYGMSYRVCATCGVGKVFHKGHMGT